MSKWYCFSQNNSGGYFIDNDVVSHYIIIEAENADEATCRMDDITIDHSQYCECCGYRWDDYIDESEAEDDPCIYGKKAEEYECWHQGSYILHFLDGRVEKNPLRVKS